jgi:hypothetical protein
MTLHYVNNASERVGPQGDRQQRISTCQEVLKNWGAKQRDSAPGLRQCGGAPMHGLRAGTQQKGSTIILFVSHNMFSIKTMCQLVIYLKQGRISYDGPTDEELRHYEADSKLATATWVRSYCDNLDWPEVYGNGTVELITPPLKLVSDRYTVLIEVREKGFQQLVAGQIGVSFHMRHEVFVAGMFGVFHEQAQWRVMEAAIAKSESEDELR